MKITLKEYFALPFQEQLDIVLSIGCYIQSSSGKERQEILYSVDRFFVELHFDYSLNKINNIIAFDSGHILNKYSKQLPRIL